MQPDMGPGSPMVPPAGGSALTNWYDLDPQVWNWFCVKSDISVGIAQDAVGLGSISLLNHPQYLIRFTHQIIGNTGDPETSGLSQDGQYEIELKDQKTTFTLTGIQASNLMGPHQYGPFPDLPFPKYYQGVNTIQLRVTNLIPRILTPEAESFIVQIAVHGVADLSVGGAR